MRGIQVVDSLPAVEAVSVLEAKSGDPLMRADAAFASGYAATEHGDAATAKDALATMQEAGADAAKKADVDSRDPKVLDIMAHELNAMLLEAGGEQEKAIAEARRAADQYAGMAFDFGPPVTFKPPHELLGELLLKQKRAEEAKAAFAKSLTFAPRRTASLLGLARAEKAMGDVGGAKTTYAELLEIWRAAEPEYAPLAEARAAVAK
jgi:tetratricopeptide (TPR) repeat protein